MIKVLYTYAKRDMEVDETGSISHAYSWMIWYSFVNQLIPLQHLFSYWIPLFHEIITHSLDNALALSPTLFLFAIINLLTMALRSAWHKLVYYSKLLSLRNTTERIGFSSCSTVYSRHMVHFMHLLSVS
jgi:hypothetical protein